MSIALNISNRDIKLAAARGDALVRWAEAPLPSGAVKDGRILDPGLVAGVINSLFKMLQLPRRPVTVTLSGMSFTYRLLDLPAVKPALLREAVERAAQKEIHVPLDELYIDWQTVRSSAPGARVFVLGVPRIQIESLLETVKLSGLDLAGVELKSLALVRASGMSDGLIVDFEPDCSNIIILSGGIPHILHTFSPKSSSASLEDNVLHLIEEMDRTIDFYNLTHQDQPVRGDSPAIFTGELANPPAWEMMLQKGTHPPLPLSPRLRIPADFPLPAFAGNIGLLTKKAAGDIDLDPLRGRKRSSLRSGSLRRFRIPAALTAAFILVAALMVVRNQAAAETASLQSEMDGLDRGIMLNNLSLSQAEETRSEIARLKDDISAWQEERRAISGKEQLSGLIAGIIACLPSGAQYERIVSDAKEVSVEAAAGSEADVFEYARQLEKSRLFSGVRIEAIEDNSAIEAITEQVKFKIVLER